MRPLTVLAWCVFLLSVATLVVAPPAIVEAIQNTFIVGNPTSKLRFRGGYMLANDITGIVIYLPDPASRSGGFPMRVAMHPENPKDIYKDEFEVYPIACAAYPFSCFSGLYPVFLTKADGFDVPNGVDTFIRLVHPAVARHVLSISVPIPLPRLTDLQLGFVRAATDALIADVRPDSVLLRAISFDPPVAESAHRSLVRIGAWVVSEDDPHNTLAQYFSLVTKTATHTSAVLRAFKVDTRSTVDAWFDVVCPDLSIAPVCEDPAPPSRERVPLLQTDTLLAGTAAVVMAVLVAVLWGLARARACCFAPKRVTFLSSFKGTSSDVSGSDGDDDDGGRSRGKDSWQGGRNKMGVDATPFLNDIDFNAPHYGDYGHSREQGYEQGHLFSDENFPSYSPATGAASGSGVGGSSGPGTNAAGIVGANNDSDSDSDSKNHLYYTGHGHDGADGDGGEPRSRTRTRGVRSSKRFDSPAGSSGGGSGGSSPAARARRRSDRKEARARAAAAAAAAADATGSNGDVAKTAAVKTPTLPGGHGSLNSAGPPPSSTGATRGASSGAASGPGSGAGAGAGTGAGAGASVAGVGVSEVGSDWWDIGGTASGAGAGQGQGHKYFFDAPDVRDPYATGAGGDDDELSGRRHSRRGSASTAALAAAAAAATAAGLADEDRGEGRFHYAPATGSGSGSGVAVAVSGSAPSGSQQQQSRVGGYRYYDEQDGTYDATAAASATAAGTATAAAGASGYSHGFGPGGFDGGYDFSAPADEAEEEAARTSARYGWG